LLYSSSRLKELLSNDSCFRICAHRPLASYFLEAAGRFVCYNETIVQFFA
jgi:hypothetical protein